MRLSPAMLDLLEDVARHTEPGDWWSWDYALIPAGGSRRFPYANARRVYNAVLARGLIELDDERGMRLSLDGWVVARRRGLA